MFINDVYKKDEIRNIAIRHLRKYGIKYRDKNSRQFVQATKTKKFFKVPLQSLANETVTLKNGQQLVIRSDSMKYVLLSIAKRKRRVSFARRMLLDRGCLGDDHHVIDVAVVLKYFLRQLPEPLIPYSFHEIFLRCSLIEKKVESTLLACLLLPPEHLNVLSFLMQFLNEVASQSVYNKMDTYNLAILVGPNIFPISEKVAPKNKLMVTKICDIIKLLIEHSRSIGVIPDYIIEQIHSNTEVVVGDRTKRRRSGSLTRIFNGLKKIIGNRPGEETVNTVTPDLLLTPSISSSKKQEEKGKLQKKHRLKSEENITKRNNKTSLERRWSAITSATSFKRKKRFSSNEFPYINSDKISLHTKDIANVTPDYVKVSKHEYEDIKNRVSAIEKRLSLELENVQSTACNNPDMNINNIIENIQSAYEQTLVHSEPLSSGTDHIARRLSRELRIRNSEEKIIRSPSARKIGNMRRKSRELERPNNKLTKNTSLRVIEMKQTNTQMVRTPSVTKSDSRLNEKYFVNNSVGRPLRQSSSFNDRCQSTRIYCNTTTRLSFDSFHPSPIVGGLETTCDDEITLSPALNKALSDDRIYVNTLSKENLNAGVKQKISFNGKIPRVKITQDKGILKQNMSPLKRTTNLKHRGRNNEKLYNEMKRLCKSNKENNFLMEDNVNRPTHVADSYTPKAVPNIKRPFVVKSPKRLCSTPQNFHRNTPMKVLSASNCYSPGVY
ncbi:hypothetical protein NQ317_011098 [Molorchus minor]|uniref:Rho-GAP domain-containing protein n=1 Tax=Molorchus minor TaxID=1323400 RepID=A0ABQ9K2V8_9CUCU|nr:hypothetical protein NQ317_011098 [Molorchus minor]